jgi:hypothetical protein
MPAFAPHHRPDKAQADEHHHPSRWLEQECLRVGVSIRPLDVAQAQLAEIIGIGWIAIRIIGGQESYAEKAFARITIKRPYRFARRP